MSRCLQQGKGKNGAIIEQGDAVRMADGIIGTVESFHGGSHTSVTVRHAGYSYTMDTSEVSPVEKK